MSSVATSPAKPSLPPDPAARTGPLRAISLIAKDIKLAHSVFALPFAIFGAFLAGPALQAAPRAWLPFLAKLAIVVVCMVLARTWAMLFNRLVDRRIDKENQRTARRVFATGELSPAVGWAVALACAGAFVGAAALFNLFFANKWPAILSVPVLAWIAFYSLTKRFTALCHLFLGGALAISPIAAAIAIDPASLSTLPILYWLAGFVLFWVAGFDVLYALQDEDFDKARGLRSIPATLGTLGALWAARALHCAAALCILAAFTSLRPTLSWIFGAAVVAVLGLLVLEHAIVSRRGKAGIPMAFFTVNGVVSCILGGAGISDLQF